MGHSGIRGSGRDRKGMRAESFQALSTVSIPVARFHGYVDAPAYNPTLKSAIERGRAALKAMTVCLDLDPDDLTQIVRR